MALSATVPEINEAIAGWEKLAREYDERAVYLEGRGELGIVHRNKAELARATAESLRLELQHGEPYCVCCLKPSGRTHPYWRNHA